MPIIRLVLVAGYVIWLGLVLTRRLQSPSLSKLPFTERLSALGLGVLLLPASIALAQLWRAQDELPIWAAAGVALALWTFAPRFVTSKVLPLALVAEGLFGFAHLQWMTANFSYVTFHPNSAGLLYRPQFVLVQAWLLIAVGLWLAWRATDKNSAIGKLVLRERSPVRGERGRPRWGLLLPVVLLLLVELLGRGYWLGTGWWSSTETLLVAAVTIFLVVRAPKTAANLALVSLILFGLYGVALGIYWPLNVPLPSAFTDIVRYGFIYVHSEGSALAAGAEGLALMGAGLWLVPRAIDDRTRALFRSASDIDLAHRVTRLTRTRADAVDSATVQLRRLERDLHDGAQARLVALGMSLRAAERLIPTSPQAAIELVAEARATSVKVLDELRDLVRGICPPVLADRGLADAVRALALDTPLRTDVDVDLPERPDLAVETACYFAVAEALTNAVKHSGAKHVQIKIGHADSALRITVIDDGCGGANPAAGSGLRGLERRLGTFDGVLAVNSPAGGPTIIAIEVPCALSSPKISSFSGMA